MVKVAALLLRIEKTDLCSISFVYEELASARKSGSTKAAVMISALLLRILEAVVKSTVYALGSLHLQLQKLQVGDVAKAIALISAKQGVRGLNRLILFAPGALSFLSMGSFGADMPIK